MSEGRAWYREPETFIAVAALVVSLSAVIVGIYEASLQRTHDRMEVWPHVEPGTYSTPTSVSVSLENTGIGPALISYIMVSIDDKPSKNWRSSLRALLDTVPKAYNTSTIGDRSMRVGEKVTLIEIPTAELPPGFGRTVTRVRITVCYGSVFHEYWMMTTQLTGRSTWKSVDSCPQQPADTDF